MPPPGLNDVPTSPLAGADDWAAAALSLLFWTILQLSVGWPRLGTGRDPSHDNTVSFLLLVGKHTEAE